MSLRRYLRPKDGLPNPRGSLSSSMSSIAIAQANKEVQEILKPKEKKRGKYNKFSAELRAEIGKYASYHGVAATARHFSRKLKKKVSESTARSIRDSYLIEAKRKRVEDLEDIEALPEKKRGRPLLLGDVLDEKVQLYLRKVREAGGTVSAGIAIAAARGLLLKYNRMSLDEFGGPVHLSRHWAYALLNRMKFVRRKATTAKSKYTVDDFDRVKKSFLDEVVTVATMEEVPPELILNWDQTGIRIVPCSPWTMDQQGARRVEMIGTNDKRQITGVFCGSLVGDFLRVQLIYKGKTARCHPRYKFPSDWNITHSPKHWSTETTMLEYIEEIIIPYIKTKRQELKEDEDEKAAIVIMDNFKGQVTDSVNQLLDSNNIHVCLLPPNTTDLLQPMDLTVNKPGKEFIKKKFENWYADKVIEQLDDEGDLEPINLGLPLLKELGAEWLVEMFHYISDNPQFITSGFICSGISHALDEQEPEDAEFHSLSEFSDSASDSDPEEVTASSNDED